MSEISFGPLLHATGTRFRLWAPKQDAVSLKLGDGSQQPMMRRPDGWFIIDCPGVVSGTRYSFVLADDLEVPDPASRCQPDGPHGQSEVVDGNTYRWKSRDWQGRPWEETVIYELHLGAFTPEGTFRSAIDKLDYLKDLGITAIQLMPVNDFPGRRGWGYDGVLPYAPFHEYGRPDELRALIDAAHGLGISVFLDVVYNHFGPDGNYLPAYAPVFTEKHRSSWGEGINYDGEGSRIIRELVIQNALYWLENFRADGLRFDAVHAIVDDSSEHLLQEMARRIRPLSAGRHIHLILENENNSSSLLARGPDGRPTQFTAQWNDDIHHVLHAAATGEAFGYYGDYADDPGKIGRALAEGFVFQGDYMPYRRSIRGEPSATLPPTAFISFIQNHDQIGNRAFGDRMTAIAPAKAIRAIAEIYLLAPQIPMLFMGEEWGSKKPFPYFCDFNEDLNEIVRQGRRKELSRLPGFADDASSAPNPTETATFESAKLRWDLQGEGEHAAWLDLYRRLLDIRRREIVPCLGRIATNGARHQTRGSLTEVTWRLDDDTALMLVANLGAGAVRREEVTSGRIIWPGSGNAGGVFPAWSVVWSIG